MRDTFMYMSDVSALVLIVFYLPICIGLLWLFNRFVIKDTLNVWARRIFIACLSMIMFLIVSWDGVVGKYYLDQFCAKDGGAYINSEALVEGIYSNSKGERRHAKYLLSKGYLFVEMNRTKNSQDGYIRYQMNLDGSTKEQLVSNIESKYTQGFDGPNKKVGPDYLNISLTEQYLESIETKERIAGFRVYQISTWLDRKLSGYVIPKTCTNIKKFKNIEKYKDSSRYHELIAKPKEWRMHHVNGNK